MTYLRHENCSLPDRRSRLTGIRVRLQCPAASRTQSCNTGCCPVNCAGYWGGYGACSADCAGGQHGDTYYHSRSASCGGSGCPYYHGYVSWASCNTHACWWDVARTGW